MVFYSIIQVSFIPPISGTWRAGPPPVLPKPKLPRETRFSNPEGPFRHNPIYVKDLAHFVRAKMQEGAAYFEQVSGVDSRFLFCIITTVVFDHFCKK